MIDVESLSFSYVSELTGDRVDALRGVNLSAHPGTLTLVCGSSGCGKSTLMRALTGLVPQMTPGTAGRGSSDRRARPLRSSPDRGWSSVFLRLPESTHPIFLRHRCRGTRILR